MKKIPTHTPARLILLFAACLGCATAAPFGPEGKETTFVQPGGEVLKLRVYGDEHYGRAENASGHTVVYNPQDGAYHYANVSADGKKLVPSGTRATASGQAGLAKHLELSNKAIREIVRASRTKYTAGRGDRWKDLVVSARQLRGDGGMGPRESAINPAPVSGTIRGLTILAQFPDDTRNPGDNSVDFPTNRQKIVRYSNNIGYEEDGNTGSVRDYFFDQSLGKLTYVQSVTEIVTLPRPRAYYNFSDYPANRVVRADAGQAGRMLIADAITVLKSQNFDFTNLTTDAQGRALATNVFFAGQDSGVWAQGLWPHQWNLEAPVSVGTAATPVSLFNYQITNIENSAPVIGTFCHENGHLILDYPDIYSLLGEGVGEHCLMGSGNHLDGGRTPAPINAYFKETVGWANVTDIAVSDFITVNLSATGNRAYRFIRPGVPTESFYVENRGDGDKWARFVRDKGIAIWHIDETIEGNVRGGEHYGVSLEQADGRADLEVGRNRGDGGDLFDAARPRFTDGTTPNARWWDGSPSTVEVEVLTGPSRNSTVTFGAVPANTIIVGSPNGGETIFRESAYAINWRANISGSVRIELLKGGVREAVIANDEPNDGTFLWTVPANLKPGKNYSIRIRSLTNPVPTQDDSDQLFAVSSATFPAKNTMPHGWHKPGSAAAGWKVTKGDAFEGSHTLSSKKTGDGEMAAIAYKSNFKSGTISFYMRVSSEAGYDFASFYIDGVKQTLLPNSTGISGSSDWVFVSKPVSAGNHTFMWTYEKDDSYGELDDMAWIDGVTLPPTTQEIQVADSAGAGMTSGTSSVSFPSVSLGSTSKPEEFTIRNSGRADLTGLAVVTDGAHKADFTVKAMKKKVLGRKTETTFQVLFAPKGVGPRHARLKILSNDADESPFEIGVSGTGLGNPKLAVYSPSSKALKNDDSRGLGIAFVKNDSNSRTFLVKNEGIVTLKKIKVNVTGSDKKDFKLKKPRFSSLAPGESMTFKVEFNPSARNKRKAMVRITSNDKITGSFQIAISGKGAPGSSSGKGKGKGKGKKTGPATAAALVDAVLGKPFATGSAQLTTVEVVDGRKYLAFTVTKSADGADPGSVEVSPDLLDWFSGTKHTSVLIDDATTLKVRDNTPLAPGVKRYIRLK